MPIDRTKNIIWVQERTSCAKGSYRVKPTSSGTALTRFCCPKGKWKRGRCVGGMKLQAVGYRKTPALSAHYPQAGKIRAVRLRRGRK